VVWGVEWLKIFKELNWSHRDLGKAASLKGWEVMAQNRAWKLLGHLVDSLIFSQIKFSCSNFGLKFGGKLYNTEIHLLCKFGGVGGYPLADKWLEPQNSPAIRVFCPLGTPKKWSVNFFYHHCKGKVFTNIFYVDVCFQRVWFRLCSLLKGRN